MKILIADDNEDTRYILKKILVAAGHQIEEAENGKTGLRLGQEQLPDLIISDILMPEMDGFQFCREIRRDKALKDTPFVFYTATYTDVKDEQLALELGADRFIRKPMDGDTFLEAIRNMVRKTARGEIQAAKPVLDLETDYLRLYNQRLIQKLEKKITALETETAARRQAESRLTATMEAVPDMIFRLDRMERFIDFKPAKGISPHVPQDAFIGRTVAEVLPDDIARLTSDTIQKVLESGQIVTYDYQLPSEGAIRDYEARCAPAGNDEVVAIVRDVTNERMAQRRLSESETRYRALVESSADHIFMLDPEGIFLASNHVCVACYFQDGDTIIGHHIVQFHQPDVAREYMGHLKRVLSTGQSISFEHRVNTADGASWHQDTLYPIFMDDQVRFVGGVCRDITNRKQAEEELRESEERLKTVLEGSQLGFWDWNIETGKVVRNAQWAEMLGYTLEEIELSVNQWADLHHPDDKAAAWQSIQDHLEGRTSAHKIEYRMLTKDGRYKWILDQAKITRRDPQGKPLRMSGTHTDITDRVNLQAQFSQAQKMESVGRLAGGVAHDFNNMLAIILGYAELGLSKVDPSQSLHSDLEEIRMAAGRSADLTRQLLAFARKQTISPKALNLNETVEGMLKMLRRLIGEDIDLAWLPGSGLWQVMMDPSQIDQILANLCVNARDAISGVGKMTIETGNRTFDEDYCTDHPGFVSGEYVMLNVSDNGCGMDKETQLHIFEPFFTTKEMGKGTGLGLATVYGIVKQNNGFINVYSEPEQGTTFTIYLPRHIGKATQTQKEASAEPAAHGSGTILLVEDDPVILDMTRMMLEKIGYVVLAAPTPCEAIRLAEAHPGEIKLIMTDVVMPDMNGLDLVRNLSSRYPNIRSLFMSGYTANVIAHHGVLDPGVHFIQKPFSIKNLAAKVSDVLDNTLSSFAE